MILAGTVGKDHLLIRRLRTLTFGLLTPFYFIRAGALVSVSALIAAPLVFVVLFAAKMGTKMLTLVPTLRGFNYLGHEGLYYSLMMSTGLTFGTISALFGLNHGIINQSQYSHLVATVIGSAVVPTALANAFFLPKHLLRSADTPTDGSIADVVEINKEGSTAIGGSHDV
jgi:Kef-type K+ transport system membrane component KefB